MEKDKDKVFFVSDSHLCHGNIIKYCNRPFMDSNEQEIVNLYKKYPNNKEYYNAYKNLTLSNETVNKHDETLISNWNSKIPYDGIVFHLGDVIFNTKKAESLLSRLNGNIFLIKGNHDKNVRSFKHKFGWIKDMFELKVKDDDYERGVRSITLCHFSMKTWNKSHRGSFHCFGHSHGNLLDDPNSLSLDVGVDCHNYSPISYNEVVFIIKKKKFKPIDHHEE